jgi:hypothetical protein
VLHERRFSGCQGHGGEEEGSCCHERQLTHAASSISLDSSYTSLFGSRVLILVMYQMPFIVRGLKLEPSCNCIERDHSRSRQVCWSEANYTSAFDNKHNFLHQQFYFLGEKAWKEYV